MQVLEQRNRLVVAVLVTVLIVGAMFTSFGRSLFALNLPQVELPQVDQSGGTESGTGSQAQYLPVSVAPDTVQSVIATLTRSDSYYRELTIETFWDTGSSSSLSQVWTDAGWTHVRQELPSGAVRHDLVGEESHYYWYEGSSSYERAPADALSADLAQRMPTYELILSLDPEEITDADYRFYGDTPCIYVESADPELGYLHRFWVNIQTGLLHAAETVREDETLLYRMSGGSAIQSPCPTSASFSLPDGTVLHDAA